MIKFSKQHFAEQVEKIVRNGSVRYLDAIQTVCEKNEIDMEAAGQYIAGALREKVTFEATNMKLLKRSEIDTSTGQLPI